MESDNWQTLVSDGKIILKLILKNVKRSEMGKDN
jgi:hypothetical protein